MTPEEEQAVYELGKAYGAIASKLDGLSPPKWTTLEAARAYVAEWLVGRPPSTSEEFADLFSTNGGQIAPTTEYGRSYRRCEAETEAFLIRLLASGELQARGILHMPGTTEATMLERMEVIWWRRLGNLDDGFPFHALLWTDGIIVRCQSPGTEPAEPAADVAILATITDIEINRIHLTEIVKPKEGADPNTAAAAAAPARGHETRGAKKKHDDELYRVLALKFLLERTTEKKDAIYRYVAEQAQKMQVYPPDETAIRAAIAPATNDQKLGEFVANRPSQIARQTSRKARR